MNHCIRVGDVAILSERGHTTEEIQLLTGHKMLHQYLDMLEFFLRSKGGKSPTINVQRLCCNEVSNALQVTETQAVTYEETPEQVRKN